MTRSVAEVPLQALGDPEDPTELPDVLAHQHDLGVRSMALRSPPLSA